jgi:acetyl-CoA decarbonylase/synthase complex subunit gamma
VDPGLYAIDTPQPDAPVLVTANYKLTLDHLRRALSGRSVWILVLETAGINVWCAAGKGTFSTQELLHRIQTVHLDEIVTHRRLILPQLGAVGVSAPAVAAAGPWRVRWGPVQAVDLPAYLDAGDIATPAMRRRLFPFVERLVLTPIELRQQVRSALILAGLLTVAMLLVTDLPTIASWWPLAVAMPMTAWLAGCLLGPLCLPWLPGRAFSIKGALLGLVVGTALAWGGGTHQPMMMIAVILLVAAATSYFLLHFTGCTTFTGITGVEREMRRALPVQGVVLLIGLVLWSLAGAEGDH